MKNIWFCKLSILIFLFSISSMASDSYDASNFFLVHISNVMAENSTKVAGSQFRTLADMAPRIDNETDNLRVRFTLHHTLNAMVAEQNHRFNFFGTEMASDVNDDNELCAYIAPLSDFLGEIYGGFQGDFMTVDRHIYGKNSIVIIPHHREKEFATKNPDFTGSVFVFDPGVLSLRDKVTSIIESMPNVLSAGKIDEYKFNKFCREQKFYYGSHANSIFELLENIFAPFRQINYSLALKNKPQLVPADEVEPLAAVINALLTKVAIDLSPNLSREKEQALRKWITHIQAWMKSFKTDARQRMKEKTSSFVDKSSAADLNLSRGLLFEEKIFERLISLSPETVSLIGESLYSHRFNKHADGLILASFIHRMNYNGDNSFFISQMRMMANSVKIAHHVLNVLEKKLEKDNSFKNKDFIGFMNSSFGRTLRKKLWNDESTVKFSTLLNKALSDVDRKQSTFLKKTFREPGSRFVAIVKSWLLERADTSSQDLFALADYDGTNSESLKNPYCSTYNYRFVKETMSYIERYGFDFLKDVRIPSHSFNYLIRLGCFQSWPDLFHELFDLNDISDEEIKNISHPLISSGVLSISSFACFLDAYREVRENREQDLKDYLPVYKIISQEVNKAGEDVVINDELDWMRYFAALQNCVRGIREVFGGTTLEIAPNWQGAKLLYQNLYSLVDQEKKKQLDAVMEPIFGAKDS